MQVGGFNQACTGRKITFVQGVGMLVYVSLCVHPRGYKKLVVQFGLPMIGKLLPVTSQFQFMARAVNIKDGHGLSNEVHCPLQLKRLYMPLR